MSASILSFGNECLQLVCLPYEPFMRKPTFCICENKDADQLRGNREADQRLCFRHTDSAIPLLSKGGALA